MKSPDGAGLVGPGVVGTRTSDRGRSTSPEAVAVEKSTSASLDSATPPQAARWAALGGAQPCPLHAGGPVRSAEDHVAEPPRPPMKLAQFLGLPRLTVHRPRQAFYRPNRANPHPQPEARTVRRGLVSDRAKREAKRAESPRSEIAAERSSAATAPNCRKRPLAGRPGSRAAGDDRREEPRVAALNTGQRGVPR